MQGKSSLKTIAFHLLSWGALYLFWIFVLGNHTLALTRTLTMEFCYLFFIAGAFYMIVFFLVPRFLHKKQFFMFFLFTLFTIAITTVLRAFTAILISTNFFPKNLSPSRGVLFLDSFLTIFFWTNALVAGWIIAERVKHQRQIIDLEKDRIENELKFLKAQNNPHFLFNSLNAIYFQIDKENHAARETLLKFSEMLRYQIYECSSEWIPVEKEIHYINNYIALQRVRLNDNFSIEISGAETIKGFLIAPMLLMPLLENAFKHVSHHTNSLNSVGLDFNCVDNWFHAKIVNTRSRAAVTFSEEGGIGLENVRRRLTLLYPNRYRFEIDDGNEYFTVTLALKTDED